MKDLTGLKFGKLSVIKAEGKNRKGSITWRCLCECGGTKVTSGDYLRNGSTKSCGCIHITQLKEGLPPKETTCTICNTKFEYTSRVAPFCCSKDCSKKYESNYASIWRNRSLENRLANMYQGIKTRCKSKGLECTITKEDLLELLELQEGRCIKTGIKLELLDEGRDTHRLPWGMSIDQIDPGKGYTKDNIQLVCLMYNLCKHTWSDEDVLKFANALINKG